MDAELIVGLADHPELELTPQPEIQRSYGLNICNWLDCFSDSHRPLEHIRRNAENGDAKWQYLLATRYDPCVGTFPQENSNDILQAFHWYSKAAEQNLNEAAFNLGSIYAHGECVGQDSSKAVNWYRKAVDGGLKEAQYNLGLMYANGDGVPQDFAEAANWYRKAGEKVAEACVNLGVLYEMGKGVAKDRTEAAKCFLQAAEYSDNDKAAFNIGLKYEKGHGVPRDYIEAYKWLHLAVMYDVEAKYVPVRNRVSTKLTPEMIVEALRRVEAYCLEHLDCSDGICDYAEAEKLYRKAAEEGNASAQCEVALICSGRTGGWYGGLERDYGEAAIWLRKAAVQGNIDAQYYLGLLYLDGHGVPQDYVQAHCWLNLAASGSSAEKSRLTMDPQTSAAAAGDDVARKMTRTQIAEAQRRASEWKVKK